MSYTTIYFLTEATNYEEAEHKVSEYLETEHFSDYSSSLPKTSGTLGEMYGELTEFAKGWDWEQEAVNCLLLAQRYKDTGDLEQYGYHLIEAGQLYAQYLTIDTYIYNIDSGDYSIPAEKSGWWAVHFGFHY